MKLAEHAIYELLKGQAGGRVYALRAPQNVESPFIVFQRTSSERWRSINNPSGIAQAVIQVDCYDSTYYGSKELSATIENLLDGYQGVVYYGGNSPQDMVRIAGISLQNDFDLLDQTEEPFLYRNTTDYLVTFFQE